MAIVMQSITLFMFCYVFCSVVFFTSALEYSNRWTVQIDGDNDEANRLARKHGFVNQGKVVDNYYSFEHPMVERISSISTNHLHKGLMLEPNVKMVEQQELKSYNLLSTYSVMDFHANDPGFKEMWYINRDDGQPTYNVIDVWKRNITGAGVVVAVVDEGFNPEHPEIQDNYDVKASFDVVENDTYPVPSNSSLSLSGHGERCAGVIAGVMNNSKCGVGLAYRASLGGIRLFISKKASDADEARALSHATDYIDIYSNSWGPYDFGMTVVGPGHLTKRALRNGVEKGRKGRGSIYVFSAGNGGFYKDSCAFSGYVNSIYTIAITGLNSDGSLPGYSEPCAGLMAVTYSRDSTGDQSKVITADTKKGCSNTFDASSAAAAMASGLIALTMSANPDLSWRDVQHIIVRTARPDPVKISNWVMNMAGLKVNDRVGFGLMDAKSMVDLAINWTTVPLKVNCTIPRYNVDRLIPSKHSLEETIDLINWSDFCGDKINFLEHVEIAVNLNYTRRGDLLIKLISPLGTVSSLTQYRMYDSALGAKDLNWVLMSLHYWGESAMGSWKLTLQNSQLHHINTGILFNWTLILHGTTENPLKNNPIHGGYSQWTYWSQCSKSCSGGTQRRSRSCNNPRPAYGGRRCRRLGKAVESRKCNTQNCPVHGGYSQWTYWSQCSKSCGEGTQQRSRSCTSPRPAYGGKSCWRLGRAVESRKCNTHHCQVNNTSCQNIASDDKCKFWKSRCETSEYMQRNCRKTCGTCRVHGGYSEWTYWSQCSKSCGRGTQRRSRSCTSPRPAYGGKSCRKLGKAVESRKCNTHNCQVNNTSCQNSLEGHSCTSWKRYCKYSQHLQHNCRKACGTCRVDGGYSQWSNWSQCSKSCGGGFQRRSRSCTNPPPAHGGKNCRTLGQATKSRRCNIHRCPATIPNASCENEENDDKCISWQSYCDTSHYVRRRCAKTCKTCQD